MGTPDGVPSPLRAWGSSQDGRSRPHSAGTRVRGMCDNPGLPLIHHQRLTAHSSLSWLPIPAPLCTNRHRALLACSLLVAWACRALCLPLTVDLEGTGLSLAGGLLVLARGASVTCLALHRLGLRVLPGNGGPWKHREEMLKSQNTRAEKRKLLLYDRYIPGWGSPKTRATCRWTPPTLK